MSLDSPTRLVIAEVLLSKGGIDLPATGTSMYPLIREGDVCRFVPLDCENLKKGDILLYQSNHGQLTAHRLIHKAGDAYLFKGDSNLGKDDWVYSDQLLGKMLYICKSYKVIHLNGLLGKTWTWSILTFPSVSKVLKRFLALKSNYMMKR
ncbi:signal peptidase I [Halobacillus litoralis]|uniref:Signal peptidase I n=1 Tax=Halobacillus litoralis TaxID=45668 RepID=A0A845F8E3_9BACI|nr:signal peptidase I [Halobacillus litoralis]MYL69927.1 signal peptidase I [Halobacillus litoralis]